MRGKQINKISNFIIPGITPACAGKTRVVISYDIRDWDHPRVCGENGMSGYSRASTPGSPPRVRGKRPCARVEISKEGITPACAGKTVQYDVNTTAAEDHPRVCGENGRRRADEKAMEGSPPRVRGKHIFFKIA